MQEAQNKRPKIKKCDLVMTAKELTNRYLWGVDLTNDEGAPYDKADLEFYIRSAQEWLQKQIPGLLLFPTVITNERHDYYATDYTSWNFIKMFRFPVQSVESLGMQFPLGTQITKFDPSWYRTESVAGQTMLVPTAGTFSSILLSQGGNYLPLLSGNQNIPMVWSIDYTAGFEKGEIPTDILNIIGLKASIMPLTIAGDLIAGAGIASKSISLDGLSQSINTTASAENTGYSANIKHREKEIDSMLKNLKEFYTGISMVVA